MICEGAMKYQRESWSIQLDLRFGNRRIVRTNVRSILCSGKLPETLVLLVIGLTLQGLDGVPGGIDNQAVTGGIDHKVPPGGHASLVGLTKPARSTKPARPRSGIQT